MKLQQHTPLAKRGLGCPAEVVKGRQWKWEVGGWSCLQRDSDYDSPMLKAFNGDAFQVSLSFNERGTMGLYMLYQGLGPVPKYTYSVGNTKGLTVQQMTAHSIPADQKQCGHWKVMSRKDGEKALESGGDDTIVISLQFDEDVIRPTGVVPTEAVWTLPSFSNTRIGPFYSHGFTPSEGAPKIALKLDVNKAARDEVILSASYRLGQLPAVWFKVVGADNSTIFETPPGTFHSGELKDSWPSIPYTALLDLAGGGDTIKVYARFGNDALVTSAQNLVRKGHWGNNDIATGSVVDTTDEDISFIHNKQAAPQPPRRGLVNRIIRRLST